MPTVPYAAKRSQVTPSAPGARLILAFACGDPPRRTSEWVRQAIDLTHIDEVCVVPER